jgi:PAS domain S-box-containing protein
MAAKKRDKEAEDQDISIRPMHNSAEKKLAVPDDLEKPPMDDRSTVFREKQQGSWPNNIEKKLSLLLIPCSLVIIALLAALNIPTAFEPPLVLPLMNTIFLGIIPIVIAYITFKVFKKNGSASVLLIGSGILIFGLGSIVAGWVNPLSGGPNMTVTLHNTCACIGSILILAGAVMSHAPAKSGRATGNTGTIAAAYTAIVVFVTVFSLATLQGMIPPFFIPGSGPTVLRQVILENATALFALSSVLFMLTYRKGRSDFFFWYSVALALIAIGLLAVFVQPSVGSLIGWVGRSAQYIGFVFALYGVLIARKTAMAQGLPLEEIIWNFFVDAEQNYRQLVETATDAIVTIDEDYRVLLWNSAAERMFGFPREDAIGVSFLKLVIDDRYIAVIKNDENDHFGHDIPALTPEPVEIVGKHKDGTLFPVEVTVSRRWQEGKLIQTCILRDITERKVAEEKLLRKNEELTATGEELKTQFDALTESERSTRLSEERLIMAQQIGRTGSWEYNVQTGKIWESAEGFHIYGFPPVAGAFPLDDIEACITERERVHQALTDLITKGEEYNIECAINPADGSAQKIIHSIARLEKDEQGNPLRVVGVIHDITDIWQIKALRESEEKLSRILNDVTDVVWSLSWPDMKVYYISPSAEKLYGRPLQEFIDKPSLWAEITHPDDIHISEKALEQLRKEGSALRECRIVRPDGTIVWIHDKSKFIFDEHDTPIRVDGISSDITERKRAEETLRESEDRFRTIIHWMQFGIVIIDAQTHTILEVNDKALEMIGGTSESVAGSVCHRFICPAELGKCPVTDLGQNIDSSERILLNLRGEKVPIIKSVIRTTLGGKDVLIESFIDITARKKAEDALALANKKLALLSGITRHDINNQMTVLMGYLTILKKKQPDPSFSDYFQKVSTAAQRISSMIKFTREYECIGVKAPAWQNCRTLAETAANEAPLGKVRVQNDLPTGAEVFADPLIVKVFYNLMDNAVQYGGKITTIRFSVDERDGDHVVVCEDDGDGVVAEDKEKIFERGFGKNTGLGLALAREILDITGITIRETGEPGKGARFEMIVPKGAYRIGPVQLNLNRMAE